MQFPAFAGKVSLNEQLGKIRSEVDEVEDARNMYEVVVELFDVIHATETAIRALEGMPGYSDVLLDKAYREVIKKNRARGYYGDRG